MDTLRELAQQRIGSQDAILLLFVSAITLLALRLFFRGASEEAIIFSVPVPEQCRAGWHGKQLDEPSIKVCCRVSNHVREG